MCVPRGAVLVQVRQPSVFGGQTYAGGTTAKNASARVKMNFGFLLQYLHPYAVGSGISRLFPGKRGEGVGHPAIVVEDAGRVGGRRKLGGCGTVYRRAAFLAVGIDIPLIGKGAAVRYAAVDIEGVGCVALGIDIALLRYQLDLGSLGCKFAIRGDPHVNFCGLRLDFLPRGIDGVGQGDRHRIMSRRGVILHPVPERDHIIL